MIFALTPIQHSVLICVSNRKAIIGTFNQEQALEGAFSVIVKSSRTLRGAETSLTLPSAPSSLLIMHTPFNSTQN